MVMQKTALFTSGVLNLGLIEPPGFGVSVLGSVAVKTHTPDSYDS